MSIIIKNAGAISKHNGLLFYKAQRSFNLRPRITGNTVAQWKMLYLKNHLIDPIVDRIGGGDAFTGGILHGLINDYLPIETIEFATGASVLKHSVKGIVINLLKRK